MCVCVCVCVFYLGRKDGFICMYVCNVERKERDVKEDIQRWNG